MIKNIVFDMGHVLMYFSPKVYISRLGYTGEDAERRLGGDGSRDHAA